MHPIRVLAALALVVVMIAGPASASTPIAGELILPHGAGLSGSVHATSTLGVLDLRDAMRADELSFSWSRAELLLVTDTRENITPAHDVVPSGPEVFMQGDDATRKETKLLPAGRLATSECGALCTAFVAVEDEGGVIGVDGLVDGPLARLGRIAEYWSGWPDESSHSFFIAAQPDWLSFGVGPEAAGTLIPQGSAFAHGSFALVLWNVTAQLEGFGEVRTGTFVTQERGPSGVLLRERSELRYAVLRVGDGDLLTGSGARVTAQLATPRVVYDGEMRARDASGWLRVGHERHELSGDEVSIEGTFGLVTHGDGSEMAIDAQLPSTQRIDVQGDAKRVFVGGASLATEGPISAPVVARVTIAAIAIIALAIMNHLGFLPLYTRITAENALRNDNRREIFAALRSGATIPDLIDQTGMPEAVVRHHLHVLERQRLIVERRDGRTKAYFRTDVHARGDLLDAHLVVRDDSRRLVGEALCRAPLAVTQAEIALATGLSQRLVSYHLGKLEKKSLVFGDGAMPRRYRAAAPLRDVIATSSPAGR